MEHLHGGIEGCREGTPNLASIFNRVERRIYEVYPWMRLGMFKTIMYNGGCLLIRICYITHLSNRFNTPRTENQLYHGISCLIRFSVEQGATLD